MDFPVPEVVIIAGPNGAGKSTFARFVLPEAMPFLNADEIAKALPGNRDRESGRLLLHRWDDLAAARQSFAIETTLASRSLAPKVAQLKTQGYRFVLIFLYSPSPELNAARVASRVRRGGHNIPEDTIRRRYELGIKNLTELYLPLADEWQIYANLTLEGPSLIAAGGEGQETLVAEASAWRRITTSH
jgi:predicted ABC-type ATPase